MDTQRKLELLDEQIRMANEGKPENFELWRQKTEVVLRNVLGDANPLYSSFTGISYSLMMFTDGTPQSAFDAAQVEGVREAIAILQAAIHEVEISGGAPTGQDGPRASGAKVFIVHGHDNARKHEVARFLTRLTSNEPLILHEQANAGRTLIEKFEHYAASTGYAVVIATGDDRGRAVDDADDKPRARQNVVFELGFFFGALGRDRVAFLYEEGLESPSDVDGLVYLPLDSGGAWKMQLARELASVGLGVDWSALGEA
ncbi:TIR domain-containing protein [Phytoactinopolyspora endophytica]|uniref:TIR domain-containing protein n=1 Tax=Phytoactinopolyspora endophytica TaxID=1642495 RepID=UPI00101DE979|nr:nucleotide-binding protein [Phytoactinopolyspora endophytica]